MLPMSKCCCCFSLRSGMLTLGWLQVILSIMSLCGVIMLDTSTSSVYKWIGKSSKAIYVLLGGSVIQTIAASLLLYGVYRTNRWLVIEYVKLETLLHVSTFFEFFVYLLLERNSFTSDQIYTLMAFLALNYGLAVYYLLAAYSYYLTMTNGEYQPLIQT